MATSKRKKKYPYPTRATTYNIAVACYLEPAKVKALSALSERTRIPKTALLREAVDDLLAKYNAARREPSGVEKQSHDRRARK